MVSWKAPGCPPGAPFPFFFFFSRFFAVVRAPPPELEVRFQREAVGAIVPAKSRRTSELEFELVQPHMTQKRKTRTHLGSTAIISHGKRAPTPLATGGRPLEETPCLGFSWGGGRKELGDLLYIKYRYCDTGKASKDVAA